MSDRKNELIAKLGPSGIAAAVLGLFPEYTPVGKDQALVRCCYHQEETPSLSVKLSTGLHNCKACSGKGDLFNLVMQVRGCDFKAALDYLAGGAGIVTTTAARPSTTIAKATAPKVKTRKVATFIYTDAEGCKLYQKERHEPARDGIRSKEFFFSSWDKDGNKQKGFKGEHVPYRLHELVKSPPEAVVYFVEGEGKADLLSSWGIVATCLDTGAESKWKPAYTPYFTGRHVVIVPDNDQAGEVYLAAVAKGLFEAAASVRVLKLPDLPEKGDVLDWIETPGNDKELFLKLADGVGTTDPILTPCPLPEKPSQAEPEAPEKSERELLAELAKMPPLQYDRCREEYASILGVRAATLDKEVMALRKDGKSTKGRRFAPEDQEPWPDPIMQPDGLLHEIDRTFRRFIVCQPEARRAAVLWVAYTWFIDVVQVAPVGLITAPERACGKTQMLSLMARLSYRPLPPASSISASSLFRLIEDYQTTLFLDECDNQLRDNPDMLLLLNSGHTRESAQVIRNEAIGDEFVPCRFSTWGAKALSGISQNHGSGKLHETLLSRSIPIEMRRKLPHETVDRIRNAEPGLFDDLRSKLARFADDYRDKVRHARPPLPETLSDRQQDNWEPLLQVAMVAGGDWLQIGIEAALKISGSEDGTKSIGEELLADIQEVFESQKIDRISTVDLLKSLCADDERPWSTYNRGLPIKPRQLASKLAGYGIHSKNVKINFGVLKGFTLDQFAEAFKRYIPVVGEISVHPLTNTINNNNIDCLTVAESEKQNATKTLPATDRLYGDDIEQLLPDLDLSVR